MNIVVTGVERFHILALKHDRPYLVGDIEPYPLESTNAPTVRTAGLRLRPWVERYLSVLSSVSDEAEFDPARLPDDPLALAYLAAALVQIPSDQKQLLLSEAQAAALLTNIQTVFRREVALLRTMLERDSARLQTQSRLFSVN